MKLLIPIIWMFFPVCGYAGAGLFQNSPVACAPIGEYSFTKTIEAAHADTAIDLPSIDHLESGAKYLIAVSSQGCFHYTTLNLAIGRQGNDYVATFGMRGKIEGRRVRQRYRKVKLTGAQLDSLRSFEKELLLISTQEGDCTTVDTYSLSIGATGRTFKDSTCTWQGISKLVATLFSHL